MSLCHLKLPINQLKPVLQSREQELRAYCPNIHTARECGKIEKAPQSPLNKNNPQSAKQYLTHTKSFPNYFISFFKMKIEEILMNYVFFNKL